MMDTNIMLNLYISKNTKQYYFKHLDFTKFGIFNKISDFFNDSDKYINTLNKLVDITRFFVNKDFSSKKVLETILAPLSFYVNMFDFNFEGIKEINFVIMKSQDYHDLRNKPNENGCQWNNNKGNNWILARIHYDLLTTLFHEITHVFDCNDNNEWKKHLDLPYSLRFHEINADILSHIGTNHYSYFLKLNNDEACKRFIVNCQNRLDSKRETLVGWCIHMTTSNYHTRLLNKSILTLNSLEITINTFRNFYND